MTASDRGSEGAGPDREGGAGDRNEGRAETSTWEWVFAACSGLLVLAVVGYLLHEGITASSTDPPIIAVRVDSVHALPSGFAVAFVASNGGRTAASVQVEGELRGPEGVVERAAVTLDYLPAHGTHRAMLHFSRDPRAFALHVRPLGYDLP